MTSDDDDDMVVARQPKPTAASIVDEGAEVANNRCFFELHGHLPNTFQRGNAHDEELLKELMAASSKSTRADRFAANDDDEDVADTAVATVSAPERRYLRSRRGNDNSKKTTMATDVGDVGRTKARENTESPEIATRSSTDVGFKNDMSLPKRLKAGLVGLRMTRIC